MKNLCLLWWCLVSSLIAAESTSPDGATAEKLGPEVSSQECPRGGCPAGEDEGFKSEEVSSQAGECPREGCLADPSREHGLKSETMESNGGTHELDEVPESKPFFGSTFSVVSDMVWTAKEQIGDTVRTAKEQISDTVWIAKEQIYDRSANWTSDIADMVREGVQEALYGFLQSVFTNIGETSSSPGTFLNSLAEIPMTIAIILLCFLLTYMVFLRFSVLFSLAFNCSIFLCHKLFGPRWIFDKLFWIGGVSFPILKFMARHYYITSVTIILIFVYTLVAPILRWSARRTARERRDIVFANIADLHERMGEIEERQQEILRILRDLDNERRMREEER